MQTLYQILGLIAAVVILFILYRAVKAKPESLSKENLSKSFFTLGVLGLILIVFVAVLVMITR